MFFFGPNVKKMCAAHNIRGLLKILALPNQKKHNPLRIEAVNALSGFGHMRVLAALIQTIENDSEDSAVQSRAHEVFKHLVYTGGTYTYAGTVQWWKENKDDPRLIEKNRSMGRFNETARVEHEAQHVFKPPKEIETMLYQQIHNSSIEYAEVTEWRNRVQPLIDASIQAGRARLEARWRAEDLVWEQDEKILNQM